MTTMTMTKEAVNNEECAIAIKRFLIKNKLGGDVRIYYNEKAISVGLSHEDVETIEDVLPSEFFTYANDETVAMSFEGRFYGVINNIMQHSTINTIERFEKLLEKHGFYYEFGDAWNLSLYKI